MPARIVWIVFDDLCIGTGKRLFHLENRDLICVPFLFRMQGQAITAFLEKRARMRSSTR